jgi:hypothetical protein
MASVGHWAKPVFGTGFDIYLVQISDWLTPKHSAVNVSTGLGLQVVSGNKKGKGIQF